jgi:hypothetical protein
VRWQPARRGAERLLTRDLGALEIVRRHAHEVHHHLMDINRYRDL